MTDNMTETVAEVEKPQAVIPTDAPATEEPFDAERAKALIDKLRQEVKENKAKAKRADELEAAEKKRKDAELSEAERLRKELEDASAKLAELTRKEMQRQAATEAGLPAALAERLRGDNLDEMTADAKHLLEVMPKAPKASNTVTNPATGQTQGESDQERRVRLGLAR